MTTPTLALGISAAGTREVESLAAAVKQLQGNLTELKNAAGGGGFSNLDNLTKEIQGMRADLAVSLAGLRTELADGFSKMGKAAEAGGDVAAAAVGKVKVRLSTAAVDLGDGVKASISASGLKAKDALIGMAAQVSSGEDAVAAAMAAAQEKQALLQAKEDELFAARLQKVKLKTAEMTAAHLEAAAKEVQAISAGNDAMVLAQLRAIAKEEDAFEARIQAMKIVSAQWETARLEQIAKEAATERLEAEQIALSAARTEAAYMAASARVQLARQISARAQLDQGISQSQVAAQFGATATAAAAEAASLEALHKAAQVTSGSVHGLTAELGWNQRAMRETGTIVNEVLQNRWNRAIGSVSSLANATGVYTLALSATGAVVAGVVVTIGALATAMYKGEQETSNFNNAMLMTGGFIGLTKGQFDQLADQLATTTVTSIGTAKAALLDMAKTGKFTGDAYAVLTEAVILTANVTGEKLEAVVKDYEKMPAGVHKWAEEHNKSMHFMSDAQLEHIRLLELQGKTQEAMIEVGKRVNDVLISQTENLGTVQRAWRALEGAASGAWNAMLGIGRTKTTEEKLKEVNEQIAKAQRQFDPSAFGGNAEARAQLPKLLSEQLSLIKQQDIQQTNAQIQAQEKLRESESAGALDAIKNLGLKVDKVAKVREETEKYLANVTKVNAAHPSADDPFHISDATVDEYKKLIAQKYNHAAATAAQHEAAAAYHAELKRLNDELSANALQEQFSADAEKRATEQLKVFYDTGAMAYGEYQKKLTALQATYSTARMQREVANEKAILSELDKLTALHDNTKNGLKPAEQQDLENQIGQLKQKLSQAHLVIERETTNEIEKQNAALVRTLAPAKAILENSDKELDKLQKGMALDIQKLDLKTNIAQLSEKEQYVQEKVLAATQATTDALFNAEEVVKKLSADGGVWAGLSPDANGSPAARELAAMLGYIDKLKASLADMKPKLHEAFALDFDAAKIQAMTKSLQTGLADAIMNAGHDGGKGLIKVLQDELLKKPFKIMLEGALQGISGGLASAAYSLFGGGNTGGGSVGGLLNMASTGSNLFNAAGSLYSVGSQYLGGTMSGTNALGTIYGNATGQGLDGLISMNGGYASAAAPTAAELGATTTLGGVSTGTGLTTAAGTTTFGVVDAGAVGAATAVEGTAAVAGGATAAGGAAAGALAAVPVVGWIALAAIALYSIFGSSGGGPKTEAGYAPSGVDISGTDIEGGHPGGQRGDVAAAKTISEGISGSYKSIADQLGVVNDKLNVGVFYAQDPEGTSQTQLQVVGGTYDRNKQMGGIENVDRGDKALQAAIALATAQLILSNLQSADIKGKVGEYIKNINPTGTTEQINASLQLAANAQSMYKAFSNLGPKFTEVTDMSVESINGLVTALGGMDKAAQSLSDYYSNFYSAAEQRTVTISNIVKTLSDNGLNFSAAEVGSASKQQFRQLVESLDLTTAEGQKTFAVLMSVEGAFSSLSDKASQFTDYLANFFSAAEQRTATVAQITKTLNDAGLTFTTSQVAAATRTQFRQVVESLDLTTEAGQASYDAMMSVAGAFASITSASTVTQTVLDNLKTAQDQVIASYQQQVSALKTFVTDIQKYLNDLALGSLSPLTPAQKYAEAEQKFQDTLAKAQGGDTTAQGQLTNAANNLLQASQMYNASSQAYTDDYNMVQAALHNTVAIATTQEATMNDQLSALGLVNTSVLSVKDAIDNLARVMAAVAGAGGTVDTSTSNLFSSGGGYQSTAGATLANNTIYSIDGHSYTVDQARGYIQTLVADGNAMGAYNAFKSAGVSLSDADKLMGWASGTATQWAIAQGLPTFGRGTNNVPSDMLALIHKDERIIPAADNRILMHRLAGGGSDTSNEIRALRIEFVTAIKELHKDNNTGHAANAIETSKAREAISGAMHTSVDKQISHERSKQRSDIQ